MPKITGINHLILVTNDMEVTVKFYRDLLGFELKATVGNESWTPGATLWKRLYFFELANGDSIGFVEFPDQDSEAEASFFSQIWPGEGRSVTRPQKMDHIALNVDDREKLVALQTQLRDMGYTVSEIQELESPPFLKSIYLYDPNGLPLEISTWDLGDPAWERRTEGSLFMDPDPVPAIR